jgi:hypothetical protein
VRRARGPRRPAPDTVAIDAATRRNLELAVTLWANAAQPLARSTAPDGSGARLLADIWRCR